MASVSEASPSRNTRGARNNLDAGEYSLWEFANRLRHSKEITMTRPPTKLTRKVSSIYKNRLALLENCDTDTPCVFKPATHLVSAIEMYNKNTNHFLVQPYNQSGENDGKATNEFHSPFGARRALLEHQGACAPSDGLEGHDEGTVGQAPARVGA